MKTKFADLIRLIRARDGLTVAQMARRCGVTASYMRTILDDGGCPSVARAEQMLVALKMSLRLGDVRAPSIETEARKPRRVRA